MPNRLLQLSGQRFGRLLVLELGKERGRTGASYWLCQCDCGKETFVRGSDLKSGVTKSCGCLKKEAWRHTVRHGLYKSLTYSTWRSMRSRCSNPNDPSYKYYGARGIAVCERWNRFEDFLEDMGDRPLGPTFFSLDRIDNNGNYEPGNCRWATHLQQR